MKPNRLFHATGRSRQRGASLFIALVALVTLTYAGLAMIRASDTGSLVAGNFAFRQAALNAADMGLEAAVTKLEAYFGLSNSAALLNANTSWGENQPVYYYAYSPNVGKIDASSTSSDTNADWDWPSGKSRRISWSSGSNFAKSLGTITATSVGENGQPQTNTVSTNMSGFSYLAVIERLCKDDGTGGIHVSGANGNVNLNCQTVALNSGDIGQSRDPLLSASVVYVSYRVTVKVTGPRNTAATVQALIAKQQPPG